MPNGNRALSNCEADSAKGYFTLLVNRRVREQAEWLAAQKRTAAEHKAICDARRAAKATK